MERLRPTDDTHHESAVTSHLVTSLEEIFWGGILIAVTMAVHGLGMLSVLRVHNGLKLGFQIGSTFAWSTGVLFTMAQDFQEQQLLALRRKHEMNQAKPLGPSRPVNPPSAE